MALGFVGGLAGGTVPSSLRHAAASAMPTANSAAAMRREAAILMSTSRMARERGACLA